MAESPVRFTPATPLPRPEQIPGLWDEFGMLDNIREHSRVVSGVALLVTDWLAESGLELNRDAVRAGALLHDIAKTPCLGQKCRHDDEGARIMQELGYPELAYLVKLHVVLPPEHPLDETMVVNYADKRVTHDQLCTLGQRYDYIAQRYGRGDPALEARIGKGLERARQVETEIFGHINSGRTPAEVPLHWREKL
ncbi:MAG: HDIG domain-containing protein [Desulfarculaceae bacterium]|nr:HDIG domain-containing protein [Desulfarculaceae bacterium]MCF8074378.1 HDIG domain-containing protein [Desulfarculaceae bacterium]MCF8103819.1 HDIG domain-containing protein [Desulfarculaceae bacterium]MCF8118158.1 HDIG domain-containing protein [Desulfarculaceae bacterium]